MAFDIVCAHCGVTFSARESKRKFCSNDCSHKGRTPSIEKRFWQRVEKREADECWPWVGHSGRGGYGVIGIGKKYHQAHRISWKLHFGDIPDGMLICHRCDNPGCCNPKHLFLGDHLANNSDRAAKGRNRNQDGVRNNQAALTDEQAKDAFRRYDAGESPRKIGEDYGVAYSTIIDIGSGTGWRHLGLPVSRRWLMSQQVDESFDLPRYSDELRRTIADRGVTLSQLSRACGVPTSTISRLLLKKVAPRVFNLVAISEWSGVNYADFCAAKDR